LLFVISALLAFSCDRGGESGAAANAAKSSPKTANEVIEAEPAPIEPGQLASKAAPSMQRGVVLGAAAAALVGRASDPALPCPPEVAQRFREMTPDPPPPALTRDAHYWISNENAHDLFRESILDLGGVLSGVGSDQVYLLAAWANASIIVPLDFDQEIVNLHHVYGIVLANVSTPAEMLQAFHKSSVEQVDAWIAKSSYPEEQKKIFVNTYDKAREKVRWRIDSMAKRYEELGIASFYQNQEQFERIKNLWAKGRVFPIRGDLTADAAMRDLAAAIKDSGLTLSVLYLSNAEAYFDYGPSYRRNIIVQPFDERSIVLRTRQADYLGVADGDEYHFSVQPGLNFAAWMAKSRIANLKENFRNRRDGGKKGFSIIDAEPPEGKKLPEVAPLDAPR
jgi:hypothetical protein